MEIAYIASPLGTVKITGDENGVSTISIVSDNSITETIPTQLQECAFELREYFDGKRTHFNCKINPKGTEFQEKVWKEVLEIPFGETISYLKLAKKIGDVKAIRAVASANGKNPLWILIPCHRVIGTDGSLTGYAGGLWCKKWLLEHEKPSGQQSLF